MSNRRPQCPSCGAKPGDTRSKRRRRFDPAPHYLLATTIASIGTLIYGGQFVGHQIDRQLMIAAIGMIVVGVVWYAGARLLAALR
ncbi:MAG: hypothetical protein AB8G17_19815 [Gammaproteobacteria bacterium]